LSAWQLKPIEKPKYKIYSTAQYRWVTLQLLLTNEIKVDAALVGQHSSKPMLAVRAAEV